MWGCLGVVDAVDAYKEAKKKGLAFNILAYICLVLAVATNDLISQAVRTTITPCTTLPILTDILTP